MPEKVFAIMREEQERKAAERAYRKEMLWRNVFPMVNWRERPLWRARAYIEPVRYGPGPVGPVEIPHWEFARRVARDTRDGRVLYVEVGRRSDRTEWTLLERFLPSHIQLGELVT